LGLAIDSRDNAWLANYFSSTVTEIGPQGTVAANYKLPHGAIPWSEAIDGSDRVWVAGFATPHVWLLCGVNTAACPPGSSTGDNLSPTRGFASRAIQHITSVQIDQSGNVWISNNWSQLAPPVGGVGVAELIGVATPVCTPLQPLPQQPAATGTACPQQTAAPRPASLAGASAGGAGTAAATSGGTSTCAWIVIGIASLAAVAGLVVQLRRRAARGAGT
jgi:hypothetical protein